MIQTLTSLTISDFNLLLYLFDDTKTINVFDNLIFVLIMTILFILYKFTYDFTIYILKVKPIFLTNKILITQYLLIEVYVSGFTKHFSFNVLITQIILIAFVWFLPYKIKNNT